MSRGAGAAHSIIYGAGFLSQSKFMCPVYHGERSLGRGGRDLICISFFLAPLSVGVVCVYTNAEPWPGALLFSPFTVSAPRALQPAGRIA